jgi:hypothetical protein
MNKQIIAVAVAGFMAVFSYSGQAAETKSEEMLASDGRALVKEFFGVLKGKLVSGLNEGGPINAIEVCNTKAPEIAHNVSQAHGWSVGRTSLKLRNPGNAPDEWESAVLIKFEERKAAGEDPNKIEHYEIVDQAGHKTFRYMKAIPTAQKPCLACHGASIEDKVSQKLYKLYPSDKARGYKEGDLRGAFTLSVQLD